MMPTRCAECKEYFDHSEYKTCPFCGAEVKEKSVSKQPAQSESSHKSWFPWINRTQAPKKPGPAEMPEEKSVEKPTAKSVEKPAALSDDSPTQAMWVVPDVYPQPNTDTIPNHQQGTISPIPGPEKKPEPTPVPAPAPAPAPAPVYKPIATPVEPDELAKTKGIFYIDDSTDAPAAAPAEPVVGWLVAIKGRHLGESFCLYTGRNFIGRSSDNAIVLSKDGHVSGVHHAAVVFEPRKRVYTVRPGETSALTYLNGAEVESSTTLNDRDIIELGNTHLMFIGLCGEHFAWEDYISRE